jgi:quercetin dioxygenase-like cupin family protein
MRGRHKGMLACGLCAGADRDYSLAIHSDYAKENQMDLKRCGSQPSAQGPEEYFTGKVRIDPLFSATEGARASGASVTFEPGARSAWHTHPRGQVLIVTAGCGWTQCWGGPIVEIRAGDVLRCPPGEKHWHGATPTTSMTHIAIQEQLDGQVVTWLEKVSDAQYLAGPTADGAQGEGARAHAH